MADTETRGNCDTGTRVTCFGLGRCFTASPRLSVPASSLLLAAFALAAAIGCSAPGPTLSIEDLQAQVVGHAKKIDQLEERVRKLEEYAGELEQKAFPRVQERLKTQDERIESLIRQMAALRRGDGGPAAGEPSVENPDLARQKAAELLDYVRQTRDWVRAVQELRPLSAHVTPVVAQALGDARIRSEVEEILARLDPKWVLPEMANLLKSRELRVSAARVLGKAGEAGAAEFLVPCLQDPDVDFRFYAAEALVVLKAREGVPVLIEGLRSESSARQTIAISALKKAIGADFGYKLGGGTAAEREAAIAQWVDFWEKFKDVSPFPWK